MKIETIQAYFSGLAELEYLFQKGFSNLNSAAEKRLEVLSIAIEDWENIHIPMPMVS